MTRLGMGHSGAVAHFQKKMAFKVLNNLIGQICYNNLDGIVVWGNTEEKFLKNLREVLQRLASFDIKAKASKLKFGDSIKYLGRIIDKKGIAI